MVPAGRVLPVLVFPNSEEPSRGSIRARDGIRYPLPGERGAAQTTLVTLFALRQDEHTRARTTPPAGERTFIACRFGSQRRLVFRCEWLTEKPADGPLPQISHLADITGQR